MRKIIAAFLFCLALVYGNAQSFNQLDIRFFNEHQGLSNNSTKCFYQDKKGFFWIGTEDGLNRYDGNSIKIYRQKHGVKNSLPGNNIISITGDDGSGLWIFSMEGIVHFFPDDETAIDYSFAVCDGIKQSIAGTIGKLFYDANHTLCLINDYGISFFNKQKNIFELHKIFLPTDSNQITRITDYFQEDKNTLLLLGYYGVIRYNTITHQYYYIKATLDYFKTKPAIPLMSFIRNNDGKLWITTYCYGLIIIDEKNNTAQSFLIDSKITNRSLQNILLFIEKPTKGIFKNDIIIGSLGYGLYVISPDEQINFKGFENIDNSVRTSDKEIAKNMMTNYCMYVDRNNLTYIGNDRGVFSISPENQVFKKYENQFSGMVTEIIKKRTPDNQTRYYFSSIYNGGFHIFDEQLNKIKSYAHVPPEAKTPHSSNINSLYTDHKNQLWICTSNGLFLYDEKNDRFKAFVYDAKNPNSIKFDKISSIIQDHAGIYWIGFFQRGFECYDAEKNIFYDLNLKTPCNDNAYVFNMVEDADQNIWIGLDKGLVKINNERNKFIFYQANQNDSSGLSNSAIGNFLLDKKNRLWIATKNGLNLYQPNTNSFKKYFRENGLHSDLIYAMAEDNKGNIWISTPNALNILNPVTDKITLHKDVPAINILCDANGKIILGGGGGPISFLTCNSSDMKRDSVLPLPYITSVKITGENKIVRNISTLNLISLKLGYKENYLSFDFTGVSFNDAHLNQFKCKLEGLENKWNDVGKIRSISYAALIPGEYNFKVMCSNSNGIWNPKIATVHIAILPPFWQTWWFRVFIIIVFSSIAYYVFQQRIKKVRAEENIKTKIAQLETQAIAAQMNPHFIFNALNSIQACIVSNNNDAAYNYLNKFSMLVRSILQNSREQFISLSNELGILKNYLELEQLRFKDLEFEMHVDKEINTDGIKVPSTFLQPFVENAIIHGLTHKAGNKLLTIEIIKNENALVFKVKDNGIGRKKSEELNRNRTKSHTSIGISLINSRLKLINEQYEIQSEVNVVDLMDPENNATGTEVTLILPMKLQVELY